MSLTEEPLIYDEAENEKERFGFRVVQEKNPERSHGEVAAKLAKNFAYVDENATVHDLSIDFGYDKSLEAVAVVTENEEILGVVVRRELFDILSKPYGRDVMKNKNVKRVMREVIAFDKDRNIFSISSMMGSELNQRNDVYFALTDQEKFYGIFSSRDMLIYLSNITQKDIALAQSLQMSIVHEETLLEKDFLTLAAGANMAKGVGGDFYNVRELAGNRLLSVVCDVSGKGVAASLVTTAISGMYNTYDFSGGLAGFVRILNDNLQSLFEGQKFVTGIFVMYNEQTGEVRFVDAGHSYVYVYRNDRLFMLKAANGLAPLGIMPIDEVKEDMLTLKKGDIFLLITDGIAEQVNPQGEEYGDRRLQKILETKKSMGMKAVKDAIFQDVYAFRGTQPQHDDMTMVLWEVK